ncbi:hypothetical protein Ssi03_16950 [Sphaerisporangium siamense]|uniref:Uncharacterized protein n=1 Tax=Sphaerisporangium siamense TaxID=795645 RepID=A0A7W7GBB2_9ACTN|nr:hypothetical protein [Sphaerisporangium siamense]MBB4704903.1 hypothetical protein [Sphaerisporangium siamense]GII83705.1 hypothetical protein Ssi03_16950 [Sphaerisporangium siamense]
MTEMNDNTGGAVPGGRDDREEWLRSRDEERRAERGSGPDPARDTDRDADRDTGPDTGADPGRGAGWDTGLDSAAGWARDAALGAGRDIAREIPDTLGSMAGEARKLFDSLQQRVGREIGKGFVKGGVSGLGQGLGQAFGAGGGGRSHGDVWGEAVSGHHDDEYICRACPVCRLKAARREAGGDVGDHLVAAAGELFAAFRQAVDAVARTAEPGGARVQGRQGGAGGPAGGAGGGTDTRVEHIDLG